MFLIASNITTRDPRVASAFRQSKVNGWNSHGVSADVLKRLAEQCAAAGAHALEIDTEQHFDEPEAMAFAVDSVQQVTDVRLCLSSNDADTLESGLKACRKPPLLNYLAIEESRLKGVLPLAVSRRGTGLVLLVSDPAAPTDALEMLEKTAILVGAANAEGVPNEDIFVDPGVVHITSEPGQRHMAQVLEFLRELPRVIDPPIRSTCWLANSSTGAVRTKRALIEAAAVFTLAGAGLSSVFLDVLRRENRRAVRLIEILQNELVYSHSDLEL